MKVKIILLLAGTLTVSTLHAQEMGGFRVDNYNGVNGVFFNPANVVDSRYKVDVNILGLNMFAGNDNISYNLGKLSDLGADSSIFSKFIGPNAKSNAMLNTSIHMPSVMFNITPHTSIAFVSRTRMMFSISDFDGNLINSVSNELSQNPPYTIQNSTNMRININAWSEYGIAIGQVLLDQGNHFLKVGGTVKYLAGIGNAYLQIDNLKGTINVDSTTSDNRTYISDATGRVAMGVGGYDINNLNNVTLNYKGSGIGADIGFVYEYRPDYLQSKANKYAFKISASLLDIGGIKYNQVQSSTGAYDVHIPSSQQFYLDQFKGSKLSDYKAVLDANPAYFNQVAGLNGNSYRVSLPTTIQLGIDFRIIPKIYVALNSQISLVNNDSKAYNPNSLNIVTLTPRFESKILAAYLPITYSSLTKMNVGFGFRAGPVYAGSSSLISSILGSSKQADFYLGFRFGIKKGRKGNNNRVRANSEEATEDDGYSL
jgi:hypothetical protein